MTNPLVRRSRLRPASLSALAALAVAAAAVLAAVPAHADAAPTSCAPGAGAFSFTGATATWQWSAYSLGASPQPAWAKAATGGIAVSADTTTFELSDGVITADSSCTTVAFAGTMRVTMPGSNWVEVDDPVLAIAADGTGSWSGDVFSSANSTAIPLVVDTLHGQTFPALAAAGSASVALDWTGNTAVGTWSPGYADSWSDGFIAAVPSAVRSFYYKSGETATGLLKPPSPVVLSWAPAGALDWGFKASWRSYVAGPAAGETILSDGAVLESDGTFSFPQTSATYDDAAKSSELDFRGSVEFHSTAHGFDVVLQDPELSVVGTTGILSAELSTDPTVGAASVARVDVATVDLATGTTSTVLGGALFERAGAPAALTSTLGALSSFYAAGTDADPVTVLSASLARDLAASVPVVSGTPVVGGRLTTVVGSWTAGTQLGYQWFADGAAITGATGPTLTLAPAQLNRTVTVRVTGSLSGYLSTAKDSAATAKVAAGALKSATPSIAGTAKVGGTLTAKPGAWAAGTKLAYKWYAGNSAIKGATKSTLALTAAQYKKTITVRVTGTLSGYTPVHKDAAKTKAVAAGTLKATVPKISGTAKVGKKLTAKAGTWTKGAKLSYQWLANGKKIAKATKSTLTLGSSLKGKKISVTVTGKLTGYATVSKASARTKAVAKK